MQSVVCTKTGKEKKWNMRGKQAELQRETVDDMVSRLHARADDDLTRAFLTVQPKKQQLTHDEDEDVAIYDDVLDICFKQYFECKRSEMIEEVVVDADDVDEGSEPKRINDLVSVASTSSPNRPSSPSSDDKSNQSNNSNSEYDEDLSGSEIDAPELPSVDDCSSLSNESSSESSSSDGSSYDDSNSCVGEKNVRRTKSASGAASPHNLTKNDKESSKISWNQPVATFDCWKLAWRNCHEMDESDWKISWQNTDTKTMKCVSHKDCAREMKVVRSKDLTGAMIYMRGSHSTTVSDEPFIGRGKNCNGFYTILHYLQCWRNVTYIV